MSQADATRLGDLQTLEREHQSQLLVANRKMGLMHKIAELSCATIMGKDAFDVTKGEVAASCCPP